MRIKIKTNSVVAEVGGSCPSCDNGKLFEVKEDNPKNVTVLGCDNTCCNKVYEITRIDMECKTEACEVSMILTKVAGAILVTAIVLFLIFG